MEKKLLNAIEETHWFDLLDRFSLEPTTAIMGMVRGICPFCVKEKAREVWAEFDNRRKTFECPTCLQSGTLLHFITLLYREDCHGNPEAAAEELLFNLNPRHAPKAAAGSAQKPACAAISDSGSGDLRKETRGRASLPGPQ